MKIAKQAQLHSDKELLIHLRETETAYNAVIEELGERGLYVRMGIDYPGDVRVPQVTAIINKE